MKRKLHLCCILLSGMLVAAPITAFAESKASQTIEPISIETETFSYYTTSADSLDKMGEYWLQESTDKLIVNGTEANFLITGIYQNKEDSNYLLYTCIDLKAVPPNEMGRGQFYSFQEVPGSESVQVGDLIYIESSCMESRPPQFGCGGKEATFTNYGNACDVLGEEFMDVLRHELVLSQFYGLGQYQYDEFKPLPVSSEIGDITELFQQSKAEYPEQVYGDFNHDGLVNASDAAIILIYAAEHGAGTFSGTFEEYMNR